jgi:hypothetical protein
MGAEDNHLFRRDGPSFFGNDVAELPAFPLERFSGHLEAIGLEVSVNILGNLLQFLITIIRAPIEMNALNMASQLIDRNVPYHLRSSFIPY